MSLVPCRVFANVLKCHLFPFFILLCLSDIAKNVVVIYRRDFAYESMIFIPNKKHICSKVSSLFPFFVFICLLDIAKECLKCRRCILVLVRSSIVSNEAKFMNHSWG